MSVDRFISIEGIAKRYGATAILLIGAVGMALDQALAWCGRLVSYAE